MLSFEKIDEFHTIRRLEYTMNTESIYLKKKKTPVKNYLSKK